MGELYYCYTYSTSRSEQYDTGSENGSGGGYGIGGWKIYLQIKLETMYLTIGTIPVSGGDWRSNYKVSFNGHVLTMEVLAFSTQRPHGYFDGRDVGNGGWSYREKVK